MFQHLTFKIATCLLPGRKVIFLLFKNNKKKLPIFFPTSNRIYFIQLFYAQTPVTFSTFWMRDGTEISFHVMLISIWLHLCLFLFISVNSPALGWKVFQLKTHKFNTSSQGWMLVGIFQCKLSLNISQFLDINWFEGDTVAGQHEYFFFNEI